MLYNGIFVCHGNMETYVAFFYKIHSIGTVNVCTNFEINRTKLTNLENMQNSCFILRHVTQKR